MNTNALDEKDVMSSGDDTLKLTTKRVRAEFVDSGTSSYVSITLGSVSSCGLITKSYPVLLIIGVLVMVVGLTFSGNTPIFPIDTTFEFPFLVPVAIALICIVAYFITRRAFITICSNGGKSIEVVAKGMSRGSIIEFLDAVENEKLKYLANHH